MRLFCAFYVQVDSAVVILFGPAPLLPPFLSHSFPFTNSNTQLHHPIPSQSRRQPPRIPRKQRRLPNIIQAQKELHDAVQAEPAAPVRTTPPPERVGVVPETLAGRVQSLQPHALDEGVVVVDALGAGHDFLPAHEEVVRVCQRRVRG